MAHSGIVHLIDRDDAARTSAQSWLKEGGFEVRAFRETEEAAVTSGEGAPSCFILDERAWKKPFTDPPRTAPQRGASPVVIVLLDHADVHLAVDAMKGGAFDVLQKPLDRSELLSAVTAALQAKSSDPISGGDLLERHDHLSHRERQVLTALIQGGTNRSIAIGLKLSPRTIEIYRANVMAKMGASSLSALVRQALSLGLLSSPTPETVNLRNRSSP